jgi:hypothetical protein
MDAWCFITDFGKMGRRSVSPEFTDSICATDIAVLYVHAKSTVCTVRIRYFVHDCLYFVHDHLRPWREKHVTTSDRDAVDAFFDSPTMTMKWHHHD